MAYREKIKAAGIRNEFDHSYLLFAMEEETREEYLLQMLLQNEIPGLLDCRIRYIEEEPFYSYEISSKKTLLQEYGDKKIRYEDLKELFYRLNEVLKRASDYLLEKAGFLLDPEYIFIDIQTEELYCVYLPISTCFESSGEKYRTLAEFLLDRTDHKDEHAVNTVYHFYKMSKEEFFSFDTFIGFLEKENLMIQAQERRREEKKSQIQERVFTEKCEENEMQSVECLNDEKETTLHWKGPCFLLVSGVLCLIPGLLIPTLKLYSIYFFMSGFTMIVLSLVLWGMALYRWFNGKEEEYILPDTQVTVEEYFDDILDNETVYFDEELTLRLKWKEGHFSKEFMLTSFPVTVGKLRESVQMQIEDESVSRLHARFTQQDEAVILQDLDSTNGTRVNGKRLLAGEEAIIRRNDEIQFGKIIVNVV